MNNSPSRFAGLVLAGGKSRRMGQDKAQMLYEGKTWLNVATELLLSAGAEEIWVNTDIETAYPKVSEPFPHQGPLSGIFGGLLSTSLDLIILPVDMPTLTVTDLNTLLAENYQTDCVYYQDSPLPCWLKNTETTRALIEQTLTNDASSNSLFANWKQLNAKIIMPSNSLENFNTPNDILFQQQKPKP